MKNALGNRLLDMSSVVLLLTYYSAVYSFCFKVYSHIREPLFNSCLINHVMNIVNFCKFFPS
jgi:hypothetical protein